MIPNRSRRGVALLTALAILVVVGGIASLMFARTLGEIRHAGDDAGIVQTLLLARGAANLGGAVLQGPVRDALDQIVQDTSSTSARWSYGTGTGDAPAPATVVQALSTNAGSVAARLQTEIDALLCGATVPGLDGGGELSLRIHVAGPSCGEALPGGVTLPPGRFVSGLPRDGSGSANDQTFALPFVIVAEGAVGPYRRNVVTAGEYQFTVGRASFAQYALFTNVHRSGGGSYASEIWFTENTLFDGPVHTNQYFRFYRNPWFGGAVTSAGCANPGLASCTSGAGTDGAEFYGEGFESVAQMSSPTSPSYSNAYGTHAPELAGGVDWSATFVPLPANAQDQEDAAQASGIAFGVDLDSLVLAAVDAAGDPVPADGSVAATHQTIEACYADRIRINDKWRDVDVCDTYRYAADGALDQKRETRRKNGNLVAAASYDWRPTGTTFNGVIHTTGDVERFTGPGRAGLGPDTASPALASFAQITVAAENDIRITGDLTYEQPPCSGSPNRTGSVVTPATCDDLGAQNILGVYSQAGDVLIGHNNWPNQYDAPDDVTIHGVLMSSRGIVGVENYGSGAASGSVNLIGGVIEYYYGAFGTFNSRTGAMSTGFSRAFTYDRRTAAGLAPPYFPTIGEDGVKAVLTFAYSQREQME